MRVFEPRLAESGAIDPRYTAARWHVSAQLAHTADLLAVEELLEKLRNPWKLWFEQQQKRKPDARDEAAFRRELMARFFFEAQPDQRPYLPIHFRELKTKTPLAGDLASLIRESNGKGLVLSARSGAGKTAAARKAFWDCFESERPATAQSTKAKSERTAVGATPGQPTLAGFIPVWIQIDSNVPSIREIKRSIRLSRAGGYERAVDAALATVTSETIQELIAHTLWAGVSTLNDSHLRAAGQALGHGPPLLLFFDLNAADELERRIIGQALHDFQKQFPRHCCIVAYRASATDEVMNCLAQDNVFRFIDLDPLDAYQAQQYLSNIREFENLLFKRLKRPPPHSVARIRADCQRLKELIQRLVRNEQSLISTPLLMHWVSLLGGSELKRVRTLYDLYDQVVEKFLARDRKVFGRAMKSLASAAGRERIVTAMVRAALAILAAGQSQTRISEKLLRNILLHPEYGRGRRVGGRPWWPDDKFWHKAPYYKTRFSENEIGAISEFSLLHQHGDTVGFVHDSFIYFFAALGLRFYDGPDQPDSAAGLDPNWFNMVVKRICPRSRRPPLPDNHRPSAWELPAEFLGGSLDARQARRLTAAFVTAPPRPGLAFLAQIVLRANARDLSHDPILGPIQLFLAREHSRLVQDPLRFQQELHNELAVSQRRTPVSRWLQSLQLLSVPIGVQLLRKLPMQRPRVNLRRFVGHTGSVTSVAFSPDGRRVLTGSDDKTARLWDAESGAALSRFEGHGGSVYSVAFSPDGRRVLTGSDDKTARLWDAESGAELRRFEGHGDDVKSVAFSPDGRRVLTGSDDKTARLWDAESGVELRRFEGHGHWVDSVAFSPDGRRVLTGLDDGTCLWDAESGAELGRFEGHGWCVPSVTFSPDGKQVLTGSADESAHLWDAESGREQRLLCGHSDSVVSVVFSPDGKRILTGSYDETARLWDTGSGAELCRFEGHGGSINSVAFSPDNRRVLTGSYDETARLWDAESVPELHRVRRHDDWVCSVAIFTTGRRALTGSYDGTARLWDTESGAELCRFNCGVNGFTSVAFAPDGRRVLTGSNDGMARIWDTKTGAELRLFKGHDDLVGSVAISSNGRRILTCSNDLTARLWDAESGTELQRFKISEADCCVVLSADGQRILIEIDPRTAYLLDAESRTELQRYESLDSAFFSFAMSPNCRHILAGSNDNTAWLWDTESGAELRHFKGHSRSIISVAFSPDGRRIVTGSSDWSVRLWDVRTGRELARAWTDADVTEVASAIAPDGEHLQVVALDSSGQWHLWEFIPEKTAPSA